MNIAWLKIPPDGRQTSGLFKSMTRELNYGLTRNNSSYLSRAVLEPATSRFQVRRPNHSATLSPTIKKISAGLMGHLACMQILRSYLPASLPARLPVYLPSCLPLSLLPACLPASLKSNYVW